MTNMKTDGLIDFDKHDLCKNVGNSLYDDVPNLGSVITLDNKGRLINSQFSKPSSAQTLLKLNSSEEVPDADDLPYSVISYGDTPNAINLPYNDHNYIGTLASKHVENYDKKALEYTNKQTIQFSNRSTFPPPTNLRISHFSSFNTNNLSKSDFGTNNHSENIFFNEKLKSNNQFNYNQTINALTPLITNKSLNNHSQPNGFVAKKQILPNTIVINSNSVNKVKSVSVIKLQRPPSLETNSIINEPRIINIPIKNQNLGNVIKNESISNELIGNNNVDKSDKTIDMIARCVCGYNHDDGGMIRCENCQTWQHIICMYPDNKFPILYKCEKCEPREIDYRRAVSTQTNYLLKAGRDPTDFLVSNDYQNYVNENNVENSHTKTHTPQYVIVQPEMKPYRHIHDTIHNTQSQILFTNSKDSQLVPPGSPRTSKRKQDLISLKSVLTKPSALPGSYTVNNIVIHNSNKPNEIQKSLLDNSMNYNYSNYLIPTSTNPVQFEKPILFTTINETSGKLKSIFLTKVQSHTNLSVSQEQFLKQNNHNINSNNNCKVTKFNYNQHIVKAIKDLNCHEIIMEFNGFITLSEDYNRDFDYRKHYNPFVLFYEKFERLCLAIDAKGVNTDSKYVRRSCTPNAEVKHRMTPNGQIRFFITPINWISNDSEITIGFDFNYRKCRYPVECSCNQPSCELIYMSMEEARQKKTMVTPLNEFDAVIYPNEHIKPSPILTKTYKKRGRAAKILNTSNRQINERPIAIENNPTTVVRRNKRGRPPLNRPNGVQRADVKAPSDSSSNNCLTEFKEMSDNESVHCRTNENMHPSLSLHSHSNFKNFKRISSSHWSLKAHRKLCANKPRPVKPCKTFTSSKVGRPLKYKKEKIIEPKKEVDYSSDPPSSPERYNGLDKSFDNNINMSSNDEYDENAHHYSGDMKHEMSREEEGKYWLEEINNKIYKQKLKEAKKIKRKCRMEKKLSRKLSMSKSQINVNLPEIQVEQNVVHANAVLQQDFKEEFIEEPIESAPQPVLDVIKEKKATPIPTPIKAKRGRKSFKTNKNYIVSYKTSNIDDVKNDLMLISACLDEEAEVEPDLDPETETICHVSEKYKEESIIAEKTGIIEAEESDRNFSDSFETKKSSTEVESFIDSSDEKLLATYKSKYRKSHSNKTKDNVKDALKASREERWVNTMWQRILKSESSDSKSKRKRSKSSFADESNPSEENPTECNELSSPKFGDSDFCDDNLSCDNKEADVSYKLNTTHKIKRKPNKLKSSLSDNSDKMQAPEKHIYNKIIENETNMKIDYSNCISNEEYECKNIESSPLNEQCGLIVYKEQQSNPMEKFSRENSAKLFNDNYSEAYNASTIPGAQHPPHAKKRWLSQALLDENLNDSSASTNKVDTNLSDALNEKFLSIESSSKHSFLPPVITSVDNTAFSSTPQKVAMNPKKRLLNQFSMEDNAFKISSADISAFNKSSKWEQQNIDQEQSKTKLTLSEYRKRRYDKSANSKEEKETTTSTKINKTNDINCEWIGLSDKCGSSPKKEKTDHNELNGSDSNSVYSDSIKKLSIKTDSSFISQNTPGGEGDATNLSSLSYLNTLNNLKMPGNLDPRLAKSTSLLSRMYLHKNQSGIEYSSVENSSKYVTNVNTCRAESCPRSPSRSPNSVGSTEWKIPNSNDRGPRTPSDIDELSINPNNENECLSTYAPSQRSIDSFESQPSPTSDCHFDFDRSECAYESKVKQSVNCDSSQQNDWTSNSSSIAKMAGIQNPDLLQEIEEFDDEYVPLPDNLPERSKEEMETLLLTQKRDSQIREWQEVKQLEREKVKLEHQVRSMQRRNLRAHKTSDILKVPSFAKPHHHHSSMDQNSEDKKYSFPLLTTNDDEKTMKTFNVQLSNFNDKLMEQINIVKNNKTAKSQPPNIDLPLSYRLSEDIVPDSGGRKPNPPDDMNNPNSSSNSKPPPKMRISDKLKSEEPPENIVNNNNSNNQSHFPVNTNVITTSNSCLQPSINCPPSQLSTSSSSQFIDIQKPEVVSSSIISDHVSNFKPMTSAFM